MGDGKWELSGPLEVLVDVSSATCGSKEKIPINRNHFEMVKYSNAYDMLYGRVRMALLPLVNRTQNSFIVASAEAGHSRA